MSENHWEAGGEPWLRRHQPETTWGPEPNPVQCLFCGARSLKRSAADHAQDPGRLELYCDNSACSAREMVLLVVRDGAAASYRADVRALQLVDDGTLDVHGAHPPQTRSFFLSRIPEVGKEVERRTRQPSR